ncbi:hypothetical protein [uncultured Algoriphagus sp.]|uniref:hypothetical protein n=1 Tax=uncultured Algoriphagus sp. TaxID=417365 RepID=UPI0030ED9C41|tara:strand:+ start:4077 stop:5075 length:999 start_codon:yes stop_codon:yes gene_type:complete
MKLKFNIESYNIEDCGFYKRGESSAKLYNLKSLIEDLSSTYQNIELQNTCTFNAASYKNQNQVFLYEIINKDRFSFITTWNKVDSDSNQVIGIKGSGKVGSSIETIKSNFGDDFIPGYATYFLIDKLNEKVFSIRPQFTLANGIRGFQTYAQNFICYFSRHVESIVVTSKKLKIVGYKESRESEPLSLISKFSLKLIYNQPEIETILKNYSHINKIIKNEKINLHSKFDGPRFIEFINFISGNNNNNKSFENNLHLELSVRPSEEDIASLVDRYKNYGENFGFKFDDNTKTIWLDNTKISEGIDLDVDFTTGNIFDGNDLMQKVISQSRSIN